jgi:hypothetical protein
MVDQSPWLAVEHNGVWRSGRSGAWLLAARWGKGGRHGDSTLPNTEAWKAARRRRTGGETSARKGDGVGTVGTKRRRVGGVRIFTNGGAAFYRAEARRGRLDAFNSRR